MNYEIEKERHLRKIGMPILFLSIAVSYAAGYVSLIVIDNFGVLGSPQEEVRCVDRLAICVGSKAEYLDLDVNQKELGGLIDLIYYDEIDRNQLVFAGPISALLKNRSHKSFDAQYSSKGKLYTFSISNGMIYKISSSARITYP